MTQNHRSVALIPTPAQRRERNRREMLDAILDAAQIILRERGVAALNLNDVAQRVGVRPPSLYKYFPSKAALYDALYAEGVRLLHENDVRIWAAYPPSWEGIEAWFRSRLALARAHRELYELVTSSPVPGFVPSEENVVAAFAAGAVVSGAVERAIAEGVIAPGIPGRRAMRLLFAASRGVIAEALGKEPIDPDGDRAEDALGDCLTLFRTAWAPQRSRDGPL
ncbi:MAG: TetR/AcrR family transcriptional regulator [Thermomicrobiales bacterium]